MPLTASQPAGDPGPIDHIPFRFLLRSCCHHHDASLPSSWLAGVCRVHIGQSCWMSFPGSIACRQFGEIIVRIVHRLPGVTGWAVHNIRFPRGQFPSAGCPKSTLAGIRDTRRQRCHSALVGCPKSTFAAVCDTRCRCHQSASAGCPNSTSLSAVTPAVGGCRATLVGCPKQPSIRLMALLPDAGHLDGLL